MKNSYGHKPEKEMSEAAAPFAAVALLATIIWGMSYSSPNYNCNNIIKEDSVGWMETGRFGSMETFYMLEKIDPMNWDNNKYFTGRGWSNDKDDVMKVHPEDTCEIKIKYFKSL